MKKRYDVKWAAVAQKDLKQIIEYIARESPGNALQILGESKQKTSDLYTLPDRGRVVPELKDQGIDIYREIIVPPWRIVYRIVDSTVFVVSVIDSRRNVEDILLQRFIR
jgi:toxin ParE1/3/4